MKEMCIASIERAFKLKIYAQYINENIGLFFITSFKKDDIETRAIVNL